MKVFGLIGEKLSHSLSPIIHNYLYQFLNIEASYSLYQVKPDLLESSVQGIRALGLHGVNVTIPYKITIMQYLDFISLEAQRIGSVNTIYNDGNNLNGYNTDYIGFGKMLARYQLDVVGKKAVVLGSGGAAKAIISYLEDMGISRIFIVTRELNNDSNIRNHTLITYKKLDLIDRADLLINCTPVGMHPNINSAPINLSQLSKFNAVVDLIYNPFYTLLLQQAKSIEIPAYNGLYMLVSQAAAAVEIWNDIKISDDIVNTVYERLLLHINT